MDGLDQPMVYLFLTTLTLLFACLYCWQCPTATLYTALLCVNSYHHVSWNIPWICIVYLSIQECVTISQLIWTLIMCGYFKRPMMRIKWWAVPLLPILLGSNDNNTSLPRRVLYHSSCFTFASMCNIFANTHYLPYISYITHLSTILYSHTNFNPNVNLV